MGSSDYSFIGAAERRTMPLSVATEMPVIDPDLVKALEANVDSGEQGRSQPVAIIDAMRKAGLFRLWTPSEYGGDEVSPGEFMSIAEALSYVDPAAGWTFANLAAGATLTAFLPEEGAREIYAGGPDVALPGSVKPAGHAIPVEGGGYRLSGRWPLASGCEHGDWIAAVCVVLEGEVPRMAPNGTPDFKVMFVRKQECTVLDTWYSLGLRGTGSTDFSLADVFVPERRVFSLFGDEPRVQGDLYRIGIIGLYAVSLASVLVGIARTSIDSFVELAKVKTPTMSQTGLAVRPTVQAQLAKAIALTGAARAFLHEAVSNLEVSVESGGSVPDEIEALRRLACANVGDSCTNAVNMIFELAGSTPIYTGTKLERCLRDIHTARQHLLVSPVWWEKTGQYYMGEGLGMP